MARERSPRSRSALPAEARAGVSRPRESAYRAAISVLDDDAFGMLAAPPHEFLGLLHLASGAADAGSLSPKLRTRARRALSERGAAWHARIVGRMIESRLGGRGAETAADVRVDAEARWLQVKRSKRKDISRRRVLRRLILQLARAHRDQRGVPVPAESLIRETWPGEQMLPEAAEQRLRTSIAELRRLGLRRVLKTQHGGYLLDPEAAVVIDAGGATHST